jgi:hypothetical protein
MRLNVLSFLALGFTCVQSSPSTHPSPQQQVLGSPYIAAEERQQQAASISVSYDGLGLDPESSGYETFVSHCKLTLHLPSLSAIRPAAQRACFLISLAVSSSRPGTSTYLAHTLPRLYPSLHATITLDYSFDFIAFASSPAQVDQGTTIKPFGNESTRIAFETYLPARKRKDGDGGLIKEEVFGQWEMIWKGDTFLIIVAEWQEGFAAMRQTHIFSPSPTHSSSLHLAVSSFTSSLPFKYVLSLRSGSSFSWKIADSSICCLPF